jgi:hypothetical protein
MCEVSVWLCVPLSVLSSRFALVVDIGSIMVRADRLAWDFTPTRAPGPWWRTTRRASLRHTMPCRGNGLGGRVALESAVQTLGKGSVGGLPRMSIVLTGCTW